MHRGPHRQACAEVSYTAAHVRVLVHLRVKPGEIVVVCRATLKGLFPRSGISRAIDRVHFPLAPLASASSRRPIPYSSKVRYHFFSISCCLRPHTSTQGLVAVTLCWCGTGMEWDEQ